MVQQYSSDSPIESKEFDKFNRFPFAERVSHVISKRTDPSSIVIGIYGVWGEGKTSVLNFMEKELNKSQNIVTIKFNPWRFGEEEQMLLGFFDVLATAIDRSLKTGVEKIGDVFGKYVKPVAKIINKEGIAEGISSFLTTADIDDLRSRVENILEEEKKRVVVLIDDIDRLEKREIHALFRLIKLTADFKYTAYVLAFDKEIVASSLQERYGSGNKEAGEAFLEKIIQVPLNLPAISSQDLLQYCVDGINEALAISDINLEAEEAQIFMKNFYYFTDKINTPRKSKLYTNILMFSLPILRNEVNTVDLMLIEGLRIFYPYIYDCIKNQPHIFVDNVRHEHLKERNKQILDELFKGYSDKEIGDIKNLLLFLFPQLNAIYNNSTYGSEWITVWTENKRVCSKKYFQRYFSYSIPSNDVSDELINKFLNKIPDRSIEESVKHLTGMINKKNALSALQKINASILNCTSEDLKKIAAILMKIGPSLPNVQSLYGFDNPYSFVSIVIGNCIQEICIEDRIPFTIDLLETQSDLGFVCQCFSYLPRDTEKYPNLKGFNTGEIDLIGHELSNKAILELRQLKEDMLLYGENLRKLLALCLEYKHNEIKDLISNTAKENPSFCISLLDYFCNTVFSSDGTMRKGNFEKEQYESITKIVNPEIMYSTLREVFPELQIGSNYPYKEDGEHNNVVKQYFWLYEKERMDYKDVN
ncbi:KAP family P-loop NTPase fold protein [Bacillus sp. AF23]|uniref:KAP family P-loop NTPase fold protein n=1 Tax=Bacillus sp. AF23 TaxID=2821151 RepID=UPI001E4463B7|nr:P-loop NTPase fold protein [Bacillus sp. AF23]MCC8351589.1 KAP family NTPase [Bacillus sp. AF23]